LFAKLRSILLRKTKKTIRDPLLALSGSSLQVYLILLSSKRPLGIREVQRKAGFKSPNSARHHLDKLIEQGFAYRVDNGYVAIKPRGSLISSFVIIRNIMFPKMFFYALASSLFLLAYIVLRMGSIDPFPTVFLTIITIMLWLDSIELIDKINKLKRIGIRK